MSGKRVSDQLWNDLVELDKELNEFLFTGRRRTISAELGRRMKGKRTKTWERMVCDVLSLVDPEHCEESHRREPVGARRRRTPLGYGDPDYE